jgi:hypothetical protein
MCVESLYNSIQRSPECKPTRKIPFLQHLKLPRPKDPKAVTSLRPSLVLPAPVAVPLSPATHIPPGILFQLAHVQRLFQEMIRARIEARSPTFFGYVGREGDDGQPADECAFTFELPNPSRGFKAVHDRHLRSVRERTKRGWVSCSVSTASPL